MDGSLPGSSVHGTFQARILECVAISFSRGSSPLRGWTWVSCIAGRFFTKWITREVLLSNCLLLMLSWVWGDDWDPFLLLLIPTTDWPAKVHPTSGLAGAGLSRKPSLEPPSLSSSERGLKSLQESKCYDVVTPASSSPHPSSTWER